MNQCWLCVCSFRLRARCLCARQSACRWACVNPCMHLCIVYACMQTHTCTCTCADVCVYIYMCMHVLFCMYVYIHVRTYVCIHVYRQRRLEWSLSLIRMDDAVRLSHTQSHECIRYWCEFAEQYHGCAWARDSCEVCVWIWMCRCIHIYIYIYIYIYITYIHT